MKIKATQGTYDFTVGNTYTILNPNNRGNTYELHDDAGHLRFIVKTACHGEWAIILPGELSKNIKVL